MAAPAPPTRPRTLTAAGIYTSVGDKEVILAETVLAAYINIQQSRLNKSTILEMEPTSQLSQVLLHSVDSVASYSSQNHVDRIRTQNFSVSSCHDEGELPPLKPNNFKRSISNLDISFSRRPESVNSNTSSTRSRLRDFVERKSQESIVNKTGDIEYFENPTETLEFDRQKSTQSSKKCKEDNKKKKRKEEKDRKPKKHEKYQSKLAEYYNLPIKLPQDEFYQHLTRSNVTDEELLRKRFASNYSDAEFNESYGKLCKHKESEGSNLRRSRSLAVIREETFTDLQIQNHNKSKRSQLIPRARLFDKPCFKDRLPGRAKYQTKEEVLESIYINTTTSCFGDINDQREPKTNTRITPDEISNKEETNSHRESIRSKSIEGSWPNLSDNITKTYTQLSEDSVNYSRNPSEIDSLDSNYVRKHFNFEAHQKSNYKESSPETDRSHSPTNEEPRKKIYIRPEEKDNEEENSQRELSLQSYYRDPKYDTDRSFSNDSVSASNSDKSQTDFNVLDISNDADSYEEVSLVQKSNEIKRKINTQTITKSTSIDRKNGDSHSIVSENDGTISTPPDSITSYVSISLPSSTEKSQKLEHLTNSLAEKIDEYCETQYRDSFIEVPLNINTNPPTEDEENPIYTSVNKNKLVNGIVIDPVYSKPVEIQCYQEHLSCSNINNVSNIYLDSDDYRTNSICRNGTSSKNITTEPFVTTLIENQYYSLPDVNISKSLRKSERIDAKLREEDPEDIHCENTYEIAHCHYNEIVPSKVTTNYGQLNNTYKKDKPHCVVQPNSNTPSHNGLDVFFNNNLDLQNCSRFEDDIKSIKSVSSIHDDKPEYVDTQQNEKEVNEIEGTIRANKLVTKSDPNKQVSSVLKPNFIVCGQDRKISACSLNNHQKDTEKDIINRAGIRKHYSLRQREPDSDQINSLPNPETFYDNSTDKKAPPQDFNINKTNTLLSRVKSFKSSPDSSIAIVPLSGHQTIIIDPPISQDSAEIKQTAINVTVNKPNLFNSKEEPRHITTQNQDKKETLATIKSSVDTSNHCTPKEAFITIKLNKVVKATIPKLRKETSDKIAAVQYKFEKPPSRLIIKDKKNIAESQKQSINMTRPQILQIVDSKNIKEKLENTDKSENSFNKNCAINLNNMKDPNSVVKREIQPHTSVSEKINNAIKTDIEYQEKLHSVKNYWSKLIDTKMNENLHESKTKESEKRSSISNESSKQCDDHSVSKEGSVSDIVKCIETVKIVDSIKKTNQAKLEIWKNETEKVKSESETEEPTLNKIMKNTENFTVPNDDNLKQNSPEANLKMIARETPEIEIVELSSDDNKNQVTQATLIKAKSYEKGCDEFDHVRYKVMKSELFKNSMIANYRKEAQFDGLLQYLQDYSFQELLINNNVVIIEPVRTKFEPAPHKHSISRISPSLLKKNDNSGNVLEKSKNAVKRHFFYHPIRVNKEIIEEELPNPDTVKKVRNLFEDTLKMRSPNQSDPPIVEESVVLSRRAASCRNINEETKVNKNVYRKKIMKNLTIDTSYGNRKWDNASLSSGVSSGDLSSNNDYETDGMSPYPQKHMRDHIYTSSSEEYLCDSLNPNFCYESQYVSQDILKKIRDCGTSITYYGGKVLNSKTAPTISPMTKAIMDEIRGLQKNCSRDCYSCQTKCHGGKCSCLVAETHKNIQDEIKLYSCTSSDSGNQDQHKKRDAKRNNSFPGFKFKLVKSNSCSSRLELTGTDDNKNPRLRYKNKSRSSIEDPPIIYDSENSVKNKVCRLESYKKGIVDTPFDQHNEKEINDYSDTIKQTSMGNVNDDHINGHIITTPGQEHGTTILNLKVKSPGKKIVSENRMTDASKVEEQTNDQDDSDKAADAHRFERKFYYVNDKIEPNKEISKKKFGEMVFEEFEVLESCYDSLNSTKSAAK